MVVLPCRRSSIPENCEPCRCQDPANPVVIHGGFQECRGAFIGSNIFYAENVEEELDADREWFMKGQTLMYIPENGTDPNSPATAIFGAVLKQVIAVDGAARLTFRGLTVTHTAPTFLDPYECPSGGDWAIHRGAAVFVQDSTNITIEGCSFDQPSGNAVLFSNAVNSSAVRKCRFKDVGDSAIAMLGSSRLMVGTAGSGKFPTDNVIEANLVDTVQL